MTERVQKFISGAGVASRRKAEEFIKSGQVFINGKKAKLGDKVDPESDVVKVYGKIVKPAAADKIYLVMNKPKGYVVSKKDPGHRKTVFDLLPADLKTKLWNVGRLDYNTEGLILFTNDGELTQELAHPSFEHEKEYEVTINQSPQEGQLENLRQGVEIATGPTSPAKVKQKGDKVFITIHEGKKRQVRRMFEAVGLPVKNLKRIRLNKLLLPPSLPLGGHKLVARDDII